MNVRFAASLAVLAFSLPLDLPGQTRDTHRVSPAFNEFLHREGVRDPETGAILSVRPKIPRFDDNPPLDCSIRKLPATNQTSRYEIVLTVHWMNTNEIHERIVLDAEPGLQTEFVRQARYRELAPVRENRQREARGARIAESSKGFLRYGMNKEEVVVAMGDNWKPGPPNQKLGAFEMRYEDVNLIFDTVLVDAHRTGEPLTNDIRPKPVPLTPFEERAKP